MRKEKNKLTQAGNEIIYRGRMSGIEITRNEQLLFNKIREEVRNDSFLSHGFRKKRCEIKNNS